MRTLLVVSTLVLGVLGGGCKSKPKRKAPPTNVGSAAATGSGSGSGSNAMRPAPDLILPRSADGGPPKKKDKPLEKADFEKLDKLEYQGFTIEHRTVGDKVMEVRQKTKDHPRLWATVTIQPCLDCIAMDLAKWKAKEEELKVVMGKLKDLPPLNAGSGSVAGSAAGNGSAVAKDSGSGSDAALTAGGVESELGATELGGATVIYHYYVGFGTSPGEGGGGTTFGNAYVAYYNDGVNQIRVLAEYKDDPATVENLKKLASKDDLRAVALSFMDVYTHAW